MTICVRTPALDEVERYIDVHRTGFNSHSAADLRARNIEFLSAPSGHTLHSAYDGAEMVGTAMSIPLTVTVPGGGAVAACGPGQRLGDIGAAIESLATARGYGLVRDFVGHGIGRRMHEEPQVPNAGAAGSGRRLKPGMTIAIEPMLNIGGGAVRALEDRWTIVTADGSLSAHVEHTIAVTEHGADVLAA